MPETEGREEGKTRPWDPDTIVFPAAPPRDFETTQDTHFIDQDAKQAAGHVK